MFKKLQKTFAMVLIMLMLMATICFAEDTVVTTGSLEDDTVGAQVDSTTPSEDEATTSEEEVTATEPELINSDVYLFDSNISYKKTVDGNVYIMGNEIEFSGIVGGDLFVLGNNVKITSDSMIYGNLYLLANTATLDCYIYGGDLYAACSNLTIGEQGAIYRDVRTTASNITINGAVGRNVYSGSNSLEIGEKAHIYGDLNYSAPTAIQVPEGTVTGTINFKEELVKESSNNVVLDYILNLASMFVYTLAVLCTLIFVAPKFLNRLENVEIKKILPACGFGLLALIVVVPVAVILLLTQIAASVALSLIAVWAFLVFGVAKSIAIISIAGFIANKLKVLAKAHNILAVILVSLLLWALNLIPVVGSIISILVCIYGLGLIITNVWKNRKAE